MSRPYTYTQLGDKVISQDQKTDYRLTGSVILYGLQSNGEWIVETKRNAFINASIIKYIKPFYGSLKQAIKQRDKYQSKYGVICDVVQLQTGDTING